MPKIIKVEDLFEDLGKRVFSEVQLQADPALLAQGWERRFTTDAQRVEEVMQLYSQLGYEVRAEPVQAVETHEGCDDCHSSVASKFSTIYTRLKKA